MTISCINCGPCDDSDCLCHKCVHVRGKRNKIAMRTAKRNNRKNKSYSESEE